MKQNPDDTRVNINTLIKTATIICSTCMLINHAAAEPTETTTATAHSEPGVISKVEHAVEHGAKAAATGVEHGLQAAGRGIERGGKAAGRGIDHGVKATKKAISRATDKSDQTPASSAVHDK